MAREASACAWLTLRQALEAFVLNVSGHQGAAHIKPLHWYVASRLVLEGGFDPDDITPRPPFTVQRAGTGYLLSHQAECGGAGEHTIIGGLKTKAVDVVVSQPGIGPVVAVSMKGTLGAFRNLTNRMEEAVGDCTNLHISYPALVYGFLQVLRGNRAGRNVHPNDVAVGADGTPSPAILRYHDVLARLTGRKDLRNETTRYEAMALVLVDADAPHAGDVVTGFPPAGSVLQLADFFPALYHAYDLRFVYAAPALAHRTRRHEWAPQSPALRDPRAGEFACRVAGGGASDAESPAPA